MSGHSKWASIKHKKAQIDAKRGKMFSKIAREITVAAKAGGGDVERNPSLRLAVTKAREVNMPQDNVDRAIKKGTGELPGVSYEQIVFEAYGPGGVAILIEALTDNKNRTSAEIRSVISKKGGNSAGAGSVSWQFAKKGYILVKKNKADEEKLLSIALEAGAEDMKAEDDNYEITTDMKDFEKVKDALNKAGIVWDVAELTMIPSSTVPLSGSAAKQTLDLVEALEDMEDVQNVYANFDIPEDILKENE
jgi:YebC/PmpR family DNA-binding regulatory protein